MKSYAEWEMNYEAEILQAEAARSEGNEGMARVCARRAAGIVVGEYLRRHNILIKSKSSFERMNFMLNQPEEDDDMKEILRYLLLRVTKDHTLPIDVDLIDATRKLKAHLIEDI